MKILFLRSLRSAAPLVAVLLIWQPSSQAQDYRGRIQGGVTDQSRSAIAGARVRLTNLGTSVVRNTETDSSGRYLFDLAEPARYSLSVEASGFAPFVAPSVLLQQRGDVTVDVSLTLGSITQEVQVTAAAAQVQFNSSKLETTVDSQIAASVPQFLRTPFFLSKLDPSAVQSETRLESQPYHSTGTGTQQVGGANGMDLQVDGAPVGLGVFTGYVPVAGYGVRS